MNTNPFKGPCYEGRQLYHMTAEDRIRMVKDFNAEQCEAALSVPNLQKTVGRAIQVRLRKLGEAA